MNNNKKTAVINSSATTDEKQPLNKTNKAIITDNNLLHNGKIIDRLETIDGKSLLEKDIPPVKFTINKILPHGLFILAGSPKVGKSWLALDFCQAVSIGGQTWDYTAEKVEVLYLALEDSLGRLKARLEKYTDIGTEDLHFGIRSMSLKDGLITQVKDFIGQHPNTSLIVVDTMQHIRNNGNDKNIYVSDYADMNTLREITNQAEIALILVTHTRKMDDPDPLNRISGSTGLVGAVDGVFILEKENRTGNSGKLTIINRDTEGFVFLLDFDKDSCHWDFIEEESDNDNEEPLDKYILKTLSENKNWSGTATDLYNKFLEYDSRLTYTPPSITKRLKARQNILKNKHNILVSFKTKNNNKLIILSCEEK